MYQFKKESTIILICILTIITFYCICWILKILNRIEKEIELFSNNDSKRERMKKIYKSDDVADPDENNDIYSDNVIDPDDDTDMDPDR